MIIHRTKRPSSLDANLDSRNCAFFSVIEGDKVYADFAINKVGDNAYIHLEVNSWGPETYKALKANVRYLQAIVRQCGCNRLIAYTENHKNTTFFKFAEAFGFNKKTARHLLCIDMEVDDE